MYLSIFFYHCIILKRWKITEYPIYHLEKIYKIALRFDKETIE